MNFFFWFQKCLDKDPSKRWNCERLLNHSYFDDYVAKQKEMEAADEANKNREKSKVKISFKFFVNLRNFISRSFGQNQ